MSMNPEMMCKGPNRKQAKKCQEQAEAYSILAKFYTMSERNQRIFIAMFNEMAAQGKTK